MEIKRIRGPFVLMAILAYLETFLYDDTLPLDHFIRFLFIFVPFHSYTFYLLSACKHFSPVLL